VVFGDDRYTYAIPKAKEMEYLECQGRYVQRVLGKTPIYTGGDQSFPILNVLHLLHPGEYDENKIDLMPIIKIRSEGNPYGLVVPRIHGHQRLKIERRRSIKKVIGHDEVIFGFALTDPLLVVLDSEQLQFFCR
jgi:chemotaxis protein histidine kinase CheA